MININDFILEQADHLVNNQLDETGILHILLCFDNNYALPTGITILSVIDKNQSDRLHIHLFMLNVSPENRAKLRSIDYKQASVSEYIINDKFSINSNNTTVFPLSACLRLIAPQLLKNMTQRLLYIDSDTLCLGNLLPLLETEMETKIIAGVPDVDEMQLKQTAKYNITGGSYVNAGVLLFNIPLWCQEDMTAKTLALLNSGNTYSHPDQDVVNILAGEQRFLLDKKYNYFVALSPNGDEDSQIPEGTLLIHYVTKNKPWHQPYRTTLFDFYLLNSPWKNDLLPRYGGKKTSSIRQYSRLMYQQGHYLTAIKFYFVYLFKKIKK